MAKRSTTKQPLSPEEWQDEWGIADPAQAGMPALFKRLGHPVFQAVQSTPRRERRRGLRPERPADGVGLAIAEARKRADLVTKPEFETIGQSPARAMREAMRAQARAAAETAAHLVPDAAPIDAKGEPLVAPPTPSPAPPASVIRKKRGALRKADARASEAAAPAPARQVEAPVKPQATPVPPAPPVPPATPVPPPTRAIRAAQAELDRARGRRVVGVRTRPAPATAAPPARPAPPAPSPRRPRGQVPLAAWAHAVADALRPEPRRVDPLGFWRTWFRIPPEVALVEYARGCRIQRLLIDAGADRVADFI